MILQALFQLAQREGLMEDPDFESKEVPWIVRVSKNGKLLGKPTDTRYLIPAEGKKKPIQKAKRFQIPRRPTGRSGTKAPPAFLVDNVKYVFGLPTKDKPFPAEEGREKSGWFLEMVAKCAQETNDEAARAVSSFLEDVAQGRTVIALPDDCRSNDLIAFALGTDPELVHQRPDVRAYWKRLRDNQDGDETSKRQCLVTGKQARAAELFELIKRLPGGTTSGVALVSFNKSAFESYGWKGNDNATVSREAAEACATALNRLLDSDYPDPLQDGQTLPRRNLKLSSDTAVCYWTAKPSGEEFCSAIGGMLEGRAEEVAELYQSIWYGKQPHIEDPSAFYALTLSGSQGRAIVRDWFESSVAKVAHNLTDYFKDLMIVRNASGKDDGMPEPFPIRLILQSLATQGKDDNIPPPFVGQLVKSALHGSPLPFSFLQRAVERARAEIGEEGKEGIKGFEARRRADARAALIKAVLNRRKRISPQTMNYQEVQPDMDPTNTSEGYTLGRLMAVLERIQQEAIGDVNASVVDRYFSGASANPKTVFVRLLKNARHHVSKAKDDSKRAGIVFLMDKLLDELTSQFDPKRNGFPAYLDLEQQGLFVLGYHHMRKWLWMSKEERAAWEQNHREAPKAFLWAKES
ncbi:MAG: type I-C CRISPR-associated protein Cas8c/Csd1 [Acidobacteria bacterium]|nr:type I-C CRISPR-associated protein Cas8c/Csd1 [Acidobacteriota bacterium]